MTAASRILIIDYGSQYTQLIARRVREARVYSEIHPPTRTIDWIREWKPTGIILSGGPNSVYGEYVPTADPVLFDVAPVLEAGGPGGGVGPRWATRFIAMSAIALSPKPFERVAPTNRIEL